MSECDHILGTIGGWEGDEIVRASSSESSIETIGERYAYCPVCGHQIGPLDRYLQAAKVRDLEEAITRGKERVRHLEDVILEHAPECNEARQIKIARSIRVTCSRVVQIMAKGLADDVRFGAIRKGWENTSVNPTDKIKIRMPPAVREEKTDE